MPRLALSLARAALVLAFVLTDGSAYALNDHSWVSSTGGGTACTRAAPCAGFAAAQVATNAGGVISVLDPGDYGNLGITKSLTVRAEGVDGGMTLTGPSGFFIIVNAGGGDIITLEGLHLNGAGGIQFNSGGHLHVVRCLISNGNVPGSSGIKFAPNSASKLSVTDTVITNLGSGTGGGIVINPQSGGSAQVALERVTVNGNAFGIAADGTGSSGGINMTIADSMVGNNAQDGIIAVTPGGGAPIGVMVTNTRSVNNSIGIRSIGPNVTVLVKNSDVTGNSTGLSFSGGGALLTYGTNKVQANGTNGAFSGAATTPVAGTVNIPADRTTAWVPGMMAVGGIPSRTTVCATVNASTYGNGASNASAGIQAAVDACPVGQVVMLSAGNFTVNNLVIINKGIILRGAGGGITILTKKNGARARTSTVVPGTNGMLTPVDPASYTYDAQPIIIVGPQRWPSSDASSQNLTADGAKGTKSVTVASASGFSVGEFVLLDERSGASWQPTPKNFPDNGNQNPATPVKVWRGDKVAWNMHLPQQKFQDDNDASNAAGPYDTTPGVLPAAMSWFSRTDRPTNEIKEIASISGNTVTFTTPLHIDYRLSHFAQLTGYTGGNAQVRNAGVENLSTIGGADGQVRFENAAYSWAKGVEVSQWIGEGFAVNNSFRIEIRDSYVHTGSWPEPGGAGYAISFANGSSEILVENNIFIDACKEMVVRSSAAGSVFGYNYTDDAWDFDNPGWVEVGINASHMAGSHHVLFEGNYSQNFDSDYTHGNAMDMTVFRNWLSGKRRSFTDVPTTGNTRAVGLAYGSWWDSFVGNVLGRSGQMAGWTYTDPAMSCDASGNNCTGNNNNWGDGDIWKLGYDPERWTMNPDLLTLSTVIRDGNFDYLTNAVHWHNTPAGYTLPPSLYLTSKPAFFGANPWPWVDPIGATKLYTLPAKARYEAGTPNTVP